MKRQLNRTIVFIILGLLISTRALWALPFKTLSEEAQVILFTCQPGQELYAGFGHSALWVGDQENRIDRLYNYGTFDFDTPNFYLKFTRGRLDYQLSVTTLGRFLAEYDYRKIGVSGQTLNLNQDEKQRLFEFLETNYLPENRNYRYDFFWDNCATRIRDAIVTIADGKVEFSLTDQHVSFRQLLFPYLKQAPWTKLGINFILGLPADQTASTFDYMYLPEYMQQGFDQAIILKDGTKRPLVSERREFLPMRLSFSRNPLLDPEVVFSVVALVLFLVTLVEFRQKKYFRWLDKLLMSIGLTAGVFLFLMWVATDHRATQYNLNCLWLIPSQLGFLILLHRKQNRNSARFLMAIIIYALIILFVQFFWPQESDWSFVLLSNLFLIRYLAYMLQLRKKGQP